MGVVPTFKPQQPHVIAPFARVAQPIFLEDASRLPEEPRPRAVSRFGLSSSWIRPTKSLIRSSVASEVSQNGYLSCGGRHAARPGCESGVAVRMANIVGEAALAGSVGRVPGAGVPPA